MPQNTPPADSPAFAIVHGEPYYGIPPSLYIPPAALKVVLTDFEGPLDLLLYLVRKHRFDILNIPMVQLCRQYARYVEQAVAEDIEVTADYLLMSAVLLEIKTRMMLPRPPSEDEDDDPRADLVRQLIIYEQIRSAATALAELPRRERDFVSPYVAVDAPVEKKRTPIAADGLAAAMAAVLARLQERHAAITIKRESISIRAVMSRILRFLQKQTSGFFKSLAAPAQGGVTFVALLQLASEGVVTLRQETNDVFVRMREGKRDNGSDNG